MQTIRAQDDLNIFHKYIRINSQFLSTPCITIEKIKKEISTICIICTD